LLPTGTILLLLVVWTVVLIFIPFDAGLLNYIIDFVLLLISGSVAFYVILELLILSGD